MSKGQGAYCFGLSVSGAIAMLMFGSAFANHYEYFGYEGDMDEAASACYKTAIVFAVMAICSVLLFVYESFKERMAPASARVKYSAV